MRSLVILLALTAIAGCSTYGDHLNTPLKDDAEATNHYSMYSATPKVNSGEFTVMLGMSGGGTRASALSYGVLKGLKNRSITLNNREIVLLDEVDFISSVSGGSFTAAYYGLYGDKIFEDYEKDFLYHDVSSDLFWRLMNPGLWFSFSGITDEAVSYYEQKLFQDATFSDLNKPDSPLIVINASDLGGGIRFSFLQEYFDMLCSDLSTYPVANAVAASSAVPIVFNPVVLRNYDGCNRPSLLKLTNREQLETVAKSTLEGLQSYADKSHRQYIHLVDGGITDNLGLLAMYDIVEVNGGGKTYFEHVDAKPQPYFLVISIDASATPESEIEKTSKEPDIGDTVQAMTSIQLHRYNDLSKNLMQDIVKQYGEDISDNDIQVTTYFVDINLNDVKDKELKTYLNNIPTDLALEPEQVDTLIQAGIDLLYENAVFNQFLQNFGEPGGVIVTSR